MPAWPENLKLLEEGYGFAPQPGGVRFSPERGPAKQRLTTRAAPSDETYAGKWTLEDRDAFWTFWKDDCKRGAISFTMDDPFSGDSAEFRFVIGQEPREA